MNRPLHVLHVVSELIPFSKTGGLADVASALPRALARAGTRSTIVTPRYRGIDPQKMALARRLAPIQVPLGKRTESVTLYEGRLPGGTVPVVLLDHPFYDRPGLYGERSGDYPDNGLRFALLARGALEVANHLDTWPDVVHAHDWQSGLSLLYAKRGAVAGRPVPGTVMTIHNLAFQGLVDKTLVDELGLGWDLWNPQGIEFYDKLSLLKAGLSFADKITTVSRTYAREIQTSEHGCGLDSYLRERAGRLVGIMNGADYDVWSPERDPYLPARFDAKDRTGKAEVKAALQRELGLPVRAGTPLIGCVSRLTEQKGFDLIAALGDELTKIDGQLVILGTGERKFEEALESLTRRFPMKVAVKLAYDERLAHRVVAGSDFYLMPSRFEPCGLNQMYSLRYGTVPLVRATGGLEDTIVDYDLKSQTGNGFKFAEYTTAAMVATLKRALQTYRNKEALSELVTRIMGLDHSWEDSARRYADLYRELQGGLTLASNAA